MVHGEKLMVAMTAPSVAMADLRLNIPVTSATSERFMMVSIGSCRPSQQRDGVAMVLPIQFDGGRTVDVRDSSTAIEASRRNAVLWKGGVRIRRAGRDRSARRSPVWAFDPLDGRKGASSGSTAAARRIPAIIRGMNLISDANFATRLSRGYSQST
jgi:hypothetical protein